MIFAFTILLLLLLFAFVFLLIYARIHTSKHQLFMLPSENSIQKIACNYSSPLYIYLTICDYFQPFAGNVSQEIAEHRVVTWCKEYSRLAKLHTDSSGRPPIHTFFYSLEEYNPQLINILYRLYKEYLADIEILGPNEDEPLDSLKQKIEIFRDTLFNQHGYLRINADKIITYRFINYIKSINTCKSSYQITSILDKIAILAKTGCYADFSSFPKKYYKNFEKQYRLENQITISNPNRFDYQSTWYPNSLNFVQDPNTVDWQNRRWGIWPYWENGEISAARTFSPFRVNLWLQNCIDLQSTDQHLFIKLHTFGGIDHNIRYLLGENGLHKVWDCLEKLCIRHNFVLNYLSAWEMYSKINALIHQNLPNKQQNSNLL